MVTTMTLTTRVRFTEPIDPRTVWNRVRELINAPENYRWTHHGAGSRPMHEGDHWPLNPEFYAESAQGADAWARVEYGAEGSALVEEWDAYPQYADDYPLDQRGPRAYVLVHLDESVQADAAVYPRIVAAMAQLGPIAWRTDYSETWQYT